MLFPSPPTPSFRSQLLVREALSSHPTQRSRRSLPTTPPCLFPSEPLLASEMRLFAYLSPVCPPLFCDVTLTFCPGPDSRASTDRVEHSLNTGWGIQCGGFFTPLGSPGRQNRGGSQALRLPPMHTCTPCLLQNLLGTSPSLPPGGAPGDKTGVQAAWPCAGRCQEPAWGAEPGPVQG